MSLPPSSVGPLHGLRVIELSSAKGAYCGKLLADMGADVVLIEPPGGDPSRRRPPFPSGTIRPEPPAEPDGLFFLYSNTNKRSLCLDLEQELGQQTFERLVAGSDLVLSGHCPAELERLGLNAARFLRLNPHLVFTAITDFGLTGPGANWKGSDLVINALSGAMNCTGFAQDPPVQLAAQPAYAMASVTAAAASLTALRHAVRCGEGQLVDVSALEAMTAVTSICGIGRWKEDGVVAHRYGTGLFAAVPSGAYHCRNGLAYVIVNRPAHWKALASWISEKTGNREVLDAMFDGPSSSRQPYRELLDVFIADLAACYDVEEFYQEGQRRHLAVTPVRTAEQLCSDAHLESRGFFCRPTDEPAAPLRYPGAYAELAKTPWMLRTSAPRCGQHNAEVLAALNAPTRTPSAELPSASLAPGQRGALAGLRVVEFTAGMAGPWIGRFMASCGADVIRVESISHPDVTRLFVSPREPAAGIQPQVSPWFTDWNAGKRFVSLDLTKKDGVAAAKKLIANCDVLIENYSTGVMTRLGLDPAQLCRENPQLVAFSSTGFGSHGPSSSHVTWGPNIEASSGLATLSGFPERDCTITQFAYPDPLSALHGLFAVLCALHHRDNSNQGQPIEIAQVQATAATLGPLLMEVLAGAGEPKRQGNRSTTASPCGVYRCRADDSELHQRWCAITVADDQQWQQLCNTIGRNDLAQDHRLQEIEGRQQHEQLVDEALTDWTLKFPAHEVMLKLQTAGVPAGVVQDVEDQALRDTQLAARGFFETIPHEVRGQVIATGIPLGLTATPPRTTSAGRAMGADNYEVFVGLCGLLDDEYESLCQQGVFTNQNQFLKR